MNLTDFLLARIAEDEAEARAAIDPEPQTQTYYDGTTKMLVDRGEWMAGPVDAYDESRVEGTFMIIYDEGGHTGEQARHIARHDPARVLAECDAKRRIVEWCSAPDADYYHEGPVLNMLALPFVDHPDWRKEWKA